MISRALLWLAFVCSCASLSAQTTWNGLRFGMTIEEVQAKLVSQSMTIAAAEGRPRHYTATPDYVLQTQGVISSILMIVEFDFGKTGLEHIRLDLDKATMLDGKVADTLMLARQLPDELTNLLSTKYGKPVDTQGSCDNSIGTLLSPVAENVITCESTWGDKGQQIKAGWHYSSIFHEVQVPVPGKNKTKRELKKDDSFGYQIDYRPLPVGL